MKRERDAEGKMLRKRLPELINKSNQECAKDQNWWGTVILKLYSWIMSEGSIEEL